MNLRATRDFDTVDPAAYLALAVEWAQSANAATLRSAVDRAYYAAFLTAREQLSGKGYGRFSQRPQVHYEVAKALVDINSDVGEMLIALRRVRNRLNYQTGRAVLPPGQSLQSLLSFAGVVVDAAQALPVAS